MTQPGQEERHELMQVVDVLAERGKLHGGREELQEARHAGVQRAAAYRDRNPELFCLPAASVCSSASHSARSRWVPRRSACRITRLPSPSSSSLSARATSRDHRGWRRPAHGTRGPGGGAGRQPAAATACRFRARPSPRATRPRHGRIHLIAPAQPQRTRADQAGQESPRFQPAAGSSVPGSRPASCARRRRRPPAGRARAGRQYISALAPVGSSTSTGPSWPPVRAGRRARASRPGRPGPARPGRSHSSSPGRR